MAEKNERELLKERAKKLGLTFVENIPTEKLKDLIDTALNDEPKMDTTPSGSEMTAPSKPETRGQMKARLAKEAGKLIRVRVTCMDPNRKEWEGELISVGNSVVGSFRKYIPFNTEWHIPNIILNHLKEAKCQVFFTTKGPRGDKIRKGKQVRAYSIDILDPLTDKELEDLAKQQAMAGTIDE